jgi:hypothetical protein
MRGTIPNEAQECAMKFFRPSDVAEWVRSDLLTSNQQRPVVAVTTNPGTGRYWIDPSVLEGKVGEWADAIALETGDAMTLTFPADHHARPRM